MKKAILLILIIGALLFGVSFSQQNHIVFADDTQIEDEINTQLGDIDFSDVENVFDSINGQNSPLFNSSSFLDKIRNLLSGEFDSGEGVIKNIFNVLFDSVLNILPTTSLIVAISLLGNMINALRPNKGKSISNVIHFVTFGVIVTLILSIVIKMIDVSSNTIISLQSQMNAIFPLLLTMLTAMGGTVSASVYQPVMALLTNGILNIFTYLLMPLFIFSVIFSILSNFSNNIKFDKFSSFFNSSFKWIIGFIFTIFSAFMTFQGMTASSVDGISIRTAKYAIRSYVPILGGYLSDGMGVILASSNLIKNAIGMGGLLLMLSSVLSPLVELILFMLALKLVAGIVQPLGSKQIADFVSSISKSMVLLIVLLVGVAFIYFILLGLVMCSANIV